VQKSFTFCVLLLGLHAVAVNGTISKGVAGINVPHSTEPLEEISSAAHSCLETLH
jgi:hypothetical protein